MGSKSSSSASQLLQERDRAYVHPAPLDEMPIHAQHDAFGACLHAEGVAVVARTRPLVSASRRAKSTRFTNHLRLVRACRPLRAEHGFGEVLNSAACVGSVRFARMPGDLREQPFERTGANGRGHLPCRRSWRVPSSAQNHAGNSGFSVDAESLARRARGGMVGVWSRLTSRRGTCESFRPEVRGLGLRRREERSGGSFALSSTQRSPGGFSEEACGHALGCSTSSRSSRRSRRSVSTSQSWTTPSGYIAGDGQDN